MPKEPKIFFSDARLTMGGAGRFFARLVSFSAYGIGAAATLALILSDIPRLNGAGLLFALFFGDRLLRYNQAEKRFVRLPKGNVNIADYVAPQAFAILEYAFRRAAFFGGHFALYVADRLLLRRDIREAVMRLDVSPTELTAKIAESLGRKAAVAQTREAVAAQAEAFMREAFAAALRGESFDIVPKDLFAALGAINDPELQTVFGIFGIASQDFGNVVIYSRFYRTFARLRTLPATLTGLAHGPYRIRHRVMNRSWTARPTPTLDNYSEDLTDLARLEKVGFLVGHKQEYEQMVDVLSRPTHPNALLIGEPGVGKETLLAHLAFEMVKDRVPAPLFDKRLVSLDIGRIVSGADPAALRARVQRIMDEIYRAGNVILVIPDAHNLVKTTGSEAMNIADIFLPAIQGDAFSAIGVTYPKEFKQYIEPQSQFSASFEHIRVGEISEDEATKILVYQSILLERQYRVVVSFGAVKKAVEIAHRYLRVRPLPSSAEGLLKETIADAAQRGDKLVNAEDIIAIAERKVNVPIHKAGKAEAEQLLNLEELIHKKLIDQEEAVTAVSKALREYRSGLSRKGGPIATFLFVGPTGVGKTELSKILSKIQFGSTEQMVRFDMTEYQDKQSFFRFIGSPDGSVSGALTDAILQKPYSLVLLDEFEKAHPDILNLFLQVFDDGRLTDNLGRTADFQNTIIIATSNAHSEFIKTSLEAGKAMGDIGAELKKRLTDHFRPELLNRFSGIIVFKTLRPEDIQKIAAFQLNDLAATIKEAQGIDVVFGDAAVAEVARLGFDPVFGARPLRGVISDKLRSVFAEKILRGELARGQRVTVTAASGQFLFQ
ncbi:MAG: ATP-dependent Clp protease ATP-binding subunit [Candidatus Harrisonbacteria bacterium]|nr:ATP-dependent Clp protease ATP-binding subunit [Candidatus Harrisonbacteria bacterium]